MKLHGKRKGISIGVESGNRMGWQWSRKDLLALSEVQGNTIVVLQPDNTTTKDCVEFGFDLRLSAFPWNSMQCTSGHGRPLYDVDRQQA